MVKTKLNGLFDVNPSRGSSTTLKSDPLPYMFSDSPLRYRQTPNPPFSLPNPENIQEFNFIHSL